MAAMTYESIVAAVRKKLSKADVSSIPGTFFAIFLACLLYTSDAADE